MPPAQKPTGAEGAARALPREQPVTAAAVTPTPVNNESAGAEGAEFIAQDLSQDPPGNDDLLLCYPGIKVRKSYLCNSGGAVGVLWFTRALSCRSALLLRVWGSSRS